MGMLYSVFPVDAEARRVLPGLGVPDLPATDGRNPTPSELRTVLQSMSDFKVTFSEPPEAAWSAFVEHLSGPDDGRCTLVHIDDYCGENQGAAFWFETGRPELILTILVGVAKRTGPLVVFADGEHPLVVQSADEPSLLYDRW